MESHVRILYKNGSNNEYPPEAYDKIKAALTNEDTFIELKDIYGSTTLIRCSEIETVMYSDRSIRENVHNMNKLLEEENRERTGWID